MIAARTGTSAVAWRTLGAVLGFGVYALFCAMPSQGTQIDEPGVVGSGVTGGMLEAWRASGCQYCHSVFGLGGHTGPDLTNVVSRSSSAYVRVMMELGLPGMPSYASVDEGTKDAIVGYLVAVDRAGRYPPASLGGPVFGER